jgi:hypothetical protein
VIYLTNVELDPEWKCVTVTVAASLLELTDELIKVCRKSKQTFDGIATNGGLGREIHLITVGTSLVFSAF